MGSAFIASVRHKGNNLTTLYDTTVLPYGRMYNNCSNTLCYNYSTNTPVYNRLL